MRSSSLVLVLLVVFAAQSLAGCATTEDAPPASTTDQGPGADSAPADDGTKESAAEDPGTASAAPVSDERRAQEDELFALIDAFDRGGDDEEQEQRIARIVEVTSALHAEPVNERNLDTAAGAVLADRIGRLPKAEQRAWIVETIRALSRADRPRRSLGVAVRLVAMERVVPHGPDGKPDSAYITAVVEEADPALAASFRSFACRAKQTEAKTHLKSLYVAEESYRIEYDTYDADLEKVGFQPHGQVFRYDYEVLEATPTTFKAVARGKPEQMPGDEWTIDQDNNLVNTKAGCPAAPAR